jgi:glycosyltransferase involved in cell wall biosynthesis
MDIKNRAIRKMITSMSYWHYRKADGLIGVFRGIAERLHTLVGIPEEKITYIPQVCEKIYERQIHDPALEKRFCDGKFNIVFAGNINPAQSFDTVTAAAKKVADAGYTGIRYIILGEGMSKQWLVDEVRRLGMEDSWVFEGLVPVEDVPKYQTVADALLVALSKSDLFEYGIPAKVQSYMASGKPVISAMDGAGKELINESGCGISVSSGDVDGLAGIIMRLHDMPQAGRAAMRSEEHATPTSKSL